MKRLIILLLTVISIIVLTACNSNELPSVSDAEQTPDTIETPSDKNTPPPRMSRLSPDEKPDALGYRGGNLGNGGLMADGGDGYVYYRSEADGWALYKAKYDGADKQKLSDEIPAGINVFDGWVYYTNYAENFPIYRIRTDGTGKQKLNTAYCAELYVTEKFIFAELCGDRNEREIYQINLDGSNATLLLRDVRLNYYYDNCIYYTLPPVFSLWKYDLQSGDRTQLTDVYSHYISVDDSGVYYWDVNNGSYNQIKTDGTENALVIGGDHFNYCDGSVYYMKLGYDNYNYYRYDVATRLDKPITKFTGEIFDGSGKMVEGANIYSLENFPSDPQSGDSFFNDGATNVYILGGRPYLRGSLRECILQTAGHRFDCLFTVDESGATVIYD
ncbi:hypothetical protein FACS1894127_3370 [Clostridia bacterium]|nr:hypothetical protein FACS1894127_3370 [Clostridia bacterium]